jgi:hypothetical protein
LWDLIVYKADFCGPNPASGALGQL